jgi:hypothetical protein
MVVRTDSCGICRYFRDVSDVEWYEYKTKQGTIPLDPRCIDNVRKLLDEEQPWHLECGKTEGRQ